MFRLFARSSSTHIDTAAGTPAPSPVESGLHLDQAGATDSVDLPPRAPIVSETTANPGATEHATTSSTDPVVAPAATTAQPVSNFVEELGTVPGALPPTPATEAGPTVGSTSTTATNTDVESPISPASTKIDAIEPTTATNSAPIDHQAKPELVPLVVTGAALGEPASVTEHEASGAVTPVSAKERSKLTKAENKDAKQVSKIIQQEAKAEEKVLKAAIKELAALQKIQKEASADEASALSQHGKAVKLEQKLTKAYLEAKAKYETAMADTKAKEQKLEALRDHLGKQAELLASKTKEVEHLRAQKSADDRERLSKMATLKTPSAF